MNDYIEGKRETVQAFRGVAVLLVVLFHYTNFFPNGYVGVDVFFVISGFVLCGNSTCGPGKLFNLVGVDGNHLNSNALLPISDYIFSKLLTPQILEEVG